MNKNRDNFNLPAKLELRRYFLRKYHMQEAIRVFDCCQGSGVIWNLLREEFQIESYWGVDINAKKGRLKIDSARIVCQALSENVIDIDTYASPWKHWEVLLPNIKHPTTVFLTRGSHSFQPLDRFEKQAIGLRFSREIPRAFWPKLRLAELSIKCCVTTVCDGIMVVEIVQALSAGNARYVGVRLEPTKTPAEPVVTAKRAKPPRAAKERVNV